MNDHSKLAPSAASIWGSPKGCTGYVKMVQVYPKRPNEFADEGQTAHDLAALWLDLLSHGKNYENQWGLIDSQEMAEAVDLYVQDVFNVMRSRSIFGGHYYNVEQRVNSFGIHPESWGKPDCWIYDEKTAELFVWDFKYGHGIVEVFENWQLIDYVAGILDQLGVNGITDQYVTVDMRVVQPRAFHVEGPVRSWKSTAANLRGYFNTLNSNAALAISNQAKLRSGNHCRYCPARHACPAAQRAAMAAIDYLAAPVGEQLSPEGIGLELSLAKRALNALEYRVTGLEAEAEQLIRSGVSIPGFNLTSAVGRQRWSKPQDEIILMGEMMGVDVTKPDLITPKQAIKKGLDQELVNEYSETPVKGFRLIEDDGTKDREIFSN